MLNFFSQKEIVSQKQPDLDLPIHEKIYEKLHYFYESKKIPHIIFHGSSGSGKRTIVDNFLNKIYDHDKSRIKSNVMFVNCAHGKGIKFIREELKFFAKTNIQSNNGVMFKTIVLVNADYLTIDAQSALRRCIELFSYNTRFFIIVENKQKLLNPILSRFCEIYVPEFIENNKVINLHERTIHRHFKEKLLPKTEVEWINKKMESIIKDAVINHSMLTDLATEWYEQGLSCLNLIEWIENTTLIAESEKAQICICFDIIKSEYRCEKLLLLYIFDYMFLRSNKDIKSILIL
jgi:replication-associated recombination protein RarA